MLRTSSTTTRAGARAAHSGNLTSLLQISGRTMRPVGKTQHGAVSLLLFLPVYTLHDILQLFTLIMRWPGARQTRTIPLSTELLWRKVEVLAGARGWGEWAEGDPSRPAEERDGPFLRCEERGSVKRALDEQRAERGATQCAHVRSLRVRQDA